ncbi:uncharacterized protein LOC110412943 [Herrania umbratica]|uniref:Uncharacterized protein LOC110412943 n=1 Tax=Herrania umbratica TaxID=108875 RepID=A0A6J0ZX59_9ROSI|nr:uncharacterized protein LOC110412943 [Herrania umbratica]
MHDSCSKNLDLECVGISPKRRKKVLIGWSAPPSEWIFSNSNGAYRLSMELATTGGVLRNSTGHFFPSCSPMFQLGFDASYSKSRSSLLGSWYLSCLPRGQCLGRFMVNQGFSLNKEFIVFDSPPTRAWDLLINCMISLNSIIKFTW